MRRKEHIRLFEWLTLVPVIISLFEMVPTKGVMIGTITNTFEWTAEVTNFNLDVSRSEAWRQKRPRGSGRRRQLHGRRFRCRSSR